MKKIRWVILVLVLAAWQGFAMQYRFTDDNEMEKLINVTRKARDENEGVIPEHPLHGRRCPYDLQNDKFKYEVIEKWYERKLYSEKIRNILRGERMYPVVLPDINDNMFVAYVCMFGCFDSNTKVLIYGQDEKTLYCPASQISGATRLLSFDPKSFLDAPLVQPRQITKIIKGDAGYKETLIDFQLANGRSLKVTPNHGMLLDDGRVILARHVKQGDSFVGLKGEKVAINNIATFEQDEGVINFRLAGPKDGSSHIMVAEGVFVGDHAWQADLEDDLNAIAIRKASIR